MLSDVNLHYLTLAARCPVSGCWPSCLYWYWYGLYVFQEVLIVVLAILFKPIFIPYFEPILFCKFWHLCFLHYAAQSTCHDYHCLLPDLAPVACGLYLLQGEDATGLDLLPTLGIVKSQLQDLGLATGPSSTSLSAVGACTVRWHQHSTGVCRFLANVNSRSRSLYAIARPSVVCL